MAGGASYPRAIDFARLRGVADEVGARLLVDIAHFAGLVAAGVHPHPFPLCRRHHHDDVQVTQGSAWRPHSLERRGAYRASRQGSGARRARQPASSRHCRQSGWPRRSAPARIQGVWTGGSRQCACSFRGTHAERSRCTDRRHGHSTRGRQPEATAPLRTATRREP